MIYISCHNDVLKPEMIKDREFPYPDISSIDPDTLFIDRSIYRKLINEIIIDISIDHSEKVGNRLSTLSNLLDRLDNVTAIKWINEHWTLICKGMVDPGSCPFIAGYGSDDPQMSHEMLSEYITKLITSGYIIFASEKMCTKYSCKSCKTLSMGSTSSHSN